MITPTKKKYTRYVPKNERWSPNGETYEQYVQRCELKNVEPLPVVKWKIINDTTIRFTHL